MCYNIDSEREVPEKRKENKMYIVRYEYPETGKTYQEEEAESFRRGIWKHPSRREYQAIYSYKAGRKNAKIFAPVKYNVVVVDKETGEELERIIVSEN